MSFMIGLCFFMYRRKPVNCQCDTKMIGWDCFGQVIAIKELLWLKSSWIQVTVVAGYYRNILHSYHGYTAVQKTSYPWLLRSHQRILLAASFIIWMLYITMITVNRYFDVDTWKIAKYRNIYIYNHFLFDTVLMILIILQYICIYCNDKTLGKLLVLGN